MGLIRHGSAPQLKKDKSNKRRSYSGGMFVFDNHIHLQPNGRCVDAVKDFERFGGTHIMLSHTPYYEFSGAAPGDYEKEFALTLQIAEKVRRETGVKVFVSLGPYPGDISFLMKTMTLAQAKEKMMRGMELAAKLVRGGEAAALGEIGRPHYPVTPDVWEASNEILRCGFALAHDVGCAVVVHSESATSQTFADLARFADDAGLQRFRVVKHYCPPVVDEKENLGIFPSVLAGRDNVKSMLKTSTRFLLETDYMDALSRPDAVMAPQTVPRNMKRLLAAGAITEEQIWKINKENPEKVYGVEID